jgi:oligo-alginate lyase
MARRLAAYLCVLVCVAAAAAMPTRIIIADGEDLDHWGSGVRREARPNEAAQGTRPSAPGTEAPSAAGSVVVDLSPGSNFTNLRHGEAGVDLSTARRLSFRWRVEGRGLESFLVKVRNYPLAGGMEAVYRVWAGDPGDDGQPWRTAELDLDQPLYDDWGGAPDEQNRYIVFRTEVVDGASPTLYLGEVTAEPRVFDWELGPPQRRDGDWVLPVTVRNHTDAPLRIVVGRGKDALGDVAVDPMGVARRDFVIPDGAVHYDRLKPLESWDFVLWAGAPGEGERRIKATTNLVRPMELERHPRLLFNAEGISALKQRIDAHDWARDRWNGVLSYVDDLLDDDVVLPPRGSNWWHWYASPKSGATLKTGKQIGEWEWEHIDPVNGDVYLGDPTDPSRDFDGIVLSRKHGGWSVAVERLGVAYQVTEDSKYADKARDILLAYAAKYGDYPLHTTRNEPKLGGGRVGPQTLDESTWLIRMAFGADLVWDALSEADRAKIADGLFLPAARDVILPHRMGVHNIQCWKNSAVGLVGFLLGDMDLIWEAIENPESGYRKQMADGVAPDGAWWEGAWGYHFYTMSALWPLAEAARNNGLDLYDDAFRGMFDAPIRFAMPDLTLPAFNDSDAVSLKGRASLYELGYARYGAPEYLNLLASGSRANDSALWFGADIAAATPERGWESVNHPESGYAILARGEGADATWLCLKYGPHGGGHGHPDKLNFVLYSRGRQIAIDPGTARYGQPIQASWYRTTLAHNTLVVDGESQKPATGKLLAFGSVGDIDYVTAEAGDIYDGVNFTRTVALLNEDLIVFLDRVEADRERTFDIAVHLPGQWADTPDGTPWADPNTPGYMHIRDASTRVVNGGVLRAKVGDTAVAITLAANAPTTVITGTGVGDHLEDRVPTAIFRRVAHATDFVWAASLTGGSVEVVSDGEVLNLSDGAGTRWRVRVHADGALTTE